MTNHVHLLAVPEKEDSLAKAVGETHRQYTRMINFRENVRGFLFQGRFSSCPVYTDQYLFTALRYIEQNPVKAKMVKFPWKYKWSSAAYHCGEISDDPEPLTDIQVQILELLETDPTISYQQLAKALNKGRSTIMRQMQVLKDIKLLKRVGSKKSGRWEVKPTFRTLHVDFVVFFNQHVKGVEIDHLFYNKFSDLTLKALFLCNVLILMKIVAKTRPRFQHPYVVVLFF